MTGSTTLNIQRLRRRRLELHLSQREVAAAAGMTAGHLSAIERGGDQSLVTLGQLQRLADRLNLTWDELLPAAQPQPALRPIIGAAEGPLAADTQALAAVLMPRKTPLNRDTAARLLKWNLRRVLDASTALAEQLPAVGLQLVTVGHDLFIQPNDAYKDVPTLAQAQRRAQVRRQLRPATMLALLRLNNDQPIDDIPGWPEIEAELHAAELIDSFGGELLVRRDVEQALDLRT